MGRPHRDDPPRGAVVLPNHPPASPEVQPESTSEVAARLLKEGLISTSDAAQMLSVKKGALTAATVARWAVQGVRTADGRVVRLEALNLGGRMKTTEAAVLRFVCRQQVDAPAPVGADRAPVAAPVAVGG